MPSGLELQWDALAKQPCKCINCASCRGSGMTSYRTGSYPEWDLDSCLSCDGRGLIEECDRCRELEELDELIREFVA